MNLYKAITEAKQNNQVAFNFLLETYWNDVFNFMLKRTKNEIDAEDVTIEAFFKAFNKIGSFDPKFKFKTWLITIAKNTHFDNLRKQKVTFLIDMSDEKVLLGEGGTEAIYICIKELGKPSGEKMMNIGNGLWTASVELQAGSYHYKFRNGLYSEWDGEGWEDGSKIGEDGCGYDKYNNRKFRLNNKDLTIGVFCWSQCTDCFGNTIPIALYENDLKDQLANRAFMFLMNFCVPVYVMLSFSLFLRFCSKQSKRLKYISESAYWIYIIHLPLTLFIPALFHQSEINIFLKFIISSFIVTLICFLTYHFFVRKTFIGEFLNGKKYN